MQNSCVLKLGVLGTFSEEDSGTAIEFKLKHIPFYIVL